MKNIAKLIAVLFYSNEPVNHKLLRKNFGISSKELLELIKNANTSLEKLGLVIIDNNQEVILTTQAGFASLIEEFYETSPQPLSQSALEVLSIIAYKQPISKNNIDEIRGVGSDQSIKNLINKQLVNKNTINNEVVYQTTTEFLNAMGIRSLNELPRPNDGITKD